MTAVAILGGGPSLTKEIVDMVRAHDVRTIVTNDTFRLAPDASMLLAADSAWWRENPEAINFAGEKIVCEDQRIAGARFYRPRYPSGGNSALHAACLAQDRGARLILLFGIDLRDDALTHWHGRHRAPLANPTPGTFKSARAAWGLFGASAGCPNVVNCNPLSGLDAFPKMMPGDGLRLVSALREMI